MQRRSTLGSRSLDLGLMVGSALIGYVLAELLFFRLAIVHLELKVRPHLTELPEVLAQSSKSSSVPRNYVAILGDSYAEGIGDWLNRVSRDKSLPFHSAHVMHEQLHRDVVSFGKAGAGSAEGMVLLPARVMGASECFIFPQLEPPSSIVVYFYEGNDIQDNQLFVRKVQGAYGVTDAGAIDRFLTAHYARFEFWRCHLYLADIAARLGKFLYRYYGSHGVRALTGFTGTAAFAANSIVVDGQTIGVPVALEGPALELNDEDIDRAIPVFARSLAWLKRRFSRVPITVVYIPSPLAIYRPATTRATYVVQPADENVSATTSVERIVPRSDQICELVRKASVSVGVGFLDTRPMLRAKAQHQLLHGPLDWGHFNEQGYRALGEFVASTVYANARKDWLMSGQLASCGWAPQSFDGL